MFQINHNQKNIINLEDTSSSGSGNDCDGDLNKKYKSIENDLKELHEIEMEKERTPNFGLLTGVMSKSQKRQLEKEIRNKLKTAMNELFRKTKVHL